MKLPLRLRNANQREQQAVNEHGLIEERFGQDSPQEREALERATDASFERELLEDLVEGIE